ncbi:unnamed protein product, partial [Meganyctiphanes norvegica]
MSSVASPKNCLEFLKTIGKLKRTGWVHREVKELRLRGAHTYAKLVINSLNLNQYSDLHEHRVMKISLVHDMAESVVGDITPHCGVSNQDKHTREVNTMQHFNSLLGEKVGGEMMELFMD